MKALHGLVSAPIAQVVSDLGGRIIEANDLAAQTLGIGRTRFAVGKPLAALVVPRERRGFRTQLAALRPGHGTRLRFTIARANDHDRRIDAYVGVDAETDVAYWILHDVTGFAQAESELRLLNAELEARVIERAQELERTYEALALEEARFAAVFEQMPGGLIVADAESDTVVLANAYVVEIFGPNIVGARVSVRDDRRHRAVGADGAALDVVDLPLVRALRGEIVTGELLRVRLEGGQMVTLETNAAPVRGPRGDIVAAVASFNDVTAREERERVEREFVQNAAHQLRTPLAAITSAVGVLHAGASEDPIARAKFLDHIAEQADRLARLTRSLLVLARAQTAQEDLEREDVELAPVLRRIASTLAAAPEVDVKVRCPSNLTAYANRDLVEEALASVGANAAQYTHSGSIVFRGSAANGRVVLSISDTGPGIPSAFRERMFDRFTRGVADGNRGFGLGLAIAAQAAAAMDGSLTVESVPGKGTTARLTLPAGGKVAV